MALDEPSNNDSVLTVDEIKVIIDSLTAFYVEGATVDYRDTGYGMQFGVSGGRFSPSEC